MKILIVHNRYRPTAPSGENAVVDQESAALAERGHEVQLFQRLSEDIAQLVAGQAGHAAGPGAVERRVASGDHRSALDDFSPDVVHLHNTFPLITPSVLYACARRRRTGGRDDPQLPAGLRQRRALPRRCGLPRLPRPIVGHRRGPRLLPRLAAGDDAGGDRLRRCTPGPGGRMISAYAFISEAQREHPGSGRRSRRSAASSSTTSFPNRRPGSTAKQHQVAYVGRLDEAKGVPFLMRAWDAFRARRPESPLRLVMAGGGKLADAVADWAAGHVIGDVRRATSPAGGVGDPRRARAP